MIPILLEGYTLTEVHLYSASTSILVVITTRGRAFASNSVSPFQEVKDLVYGYIFLSYFR